ncbi:flagellar biosynthesis anti-sigma factor FlgM [Fictibacillus enclensis]|uniref:flagellar biosynthesis anti-sigma factor FlgM n=1 Tax=Fictibacillus enclensis TaxID=1017270 RepID=UPI0024C0D419|nr:flagellar biosynthesis anti-sigma factor FlgM [Fictibacillus enclensis]MDM5198456.1 flagellar biosynthesis anti-sigma factor FlgM [Fictibacillus enclensis]MDM5337656.1 flagellar biosynthesis anti-sigma factor FlgM [Fictibacillus enclensis]WHY74022.1 flagellar biosynthesis anti-sigma factor FlgM [Fictibacillus enclensis]
MKINGIQRVEQPYKTTEVMKPQKVSKPSLQDSVEISREGLLLNQTTAGMPSERLAKIEELKQKIKAGEYQIEPEKIAAKIASYYQK